MSTSRPPQMPATPPSPGGEPPPLVVAATPVLAVEAAHLAEARRALRTQGRELDDEALTRLLWAARTLPAALDALADLRSELPLADAQMDAVQVDVADRAARGPLVAIAHLDEDHVIVEVVDQRALLLSDIGEVPPCCTVRFRVSRAPTPGDAAGDTSIPLHRFTLGRPG